MYKVAFDGTMNDKSRVPEGELPTLVAHIATLIDAKYYAGPAMRDSVGIDWLDAMFGFSSRQTAEDAARDFFAAAIKMRTESPECELRVFVTGFSRGAASARHFMNAVERGWDSQREATVGPPRFYAFLFDTVATGQLQNLELQLPSSVEYLIHVVAKDEPRGLFIPVIDAADTTEVDTSDSLSWPYPKRINLLVLPGAHSDIAGVYAQGVGNIYREMAEHILFRLGLTEKNCWESDQDYALGGKHDSRGYWDLLQGRSAPNETSQESRDYYLTPVRSRSIDEIASSLNRLIALSNANSLRGVQTASQTHYLEIPSITVKRRGDKLEFVSSESIDFSTLEFSSHDGIRRLSYRLKKDRLSAQSTWLLNDDVWRALPDSKEAVLTYSLQQRKDGEYFHFFVDNVRHATYKSDSSSTLFLANPKKLCAPDLNGILRSPRKFFITSPAG